MADTSPQAGPAPLGIGTDEWVARHDERTAAPTGPAAWAAAVPPWTWWALPLLAAALLPLVVDNGFVLRVGVNLGLFALLALGLNVVVGYAGLLDLGYVAFYGIGAYGYAMLSSDKFGVHLPTLVSVPIVVAVAALAGLMLGLPSRRLLGDYLAIVTLFFGQVFVELALSADTLTLPGRDEPVDVTGGVNGISALDPFVLLGHRFDGRDYYYLLLVLVAVLALGLHRVNTGRTGRAWRASGEDPLAAEAMTIPVNRLKILAFVVGAGIAGLSGSVFAAVQAGVYPSSFDLPVLVLVYAAVILGGSGSLVGTLVGAAVISVLPEVLRAPAYADALFFGVLLLGLVLTLRRRVLAAVLAATALMGPVMTGLLLLGGVEDLPADEWTAGPISTALGRWLFVPEDRVAWGNAGFVALVVLIAVLTKVPPRVRLPLLPVTIWLGIFVWEVRLVPEPSLTRQLMIGTLLIVLMVVRPQGLFGRQRVEVL